MSTKLMVIAADESVKSIVRYLLDLPGVEDVRFVKEPDTPTDTQHGVDMGPAPHQHVRTMGQLPSPTMKGKSVNGAHWVPSDAIVVPVCMYIAKLDRTFVNSRTIVEWRKCSYKAARDILVELERRNLLQYSHKEGMGGSIQYRVLEKLTKTYGGQP